MATGASSNLPLRFGVFELDAVTGELRKSGRMIRLRPQAAKILVLLASRPGQLVTREELRGKIWGNETFVDFEHGLNLCIREVRAALDDDADTPRYVETLPKRGYRFIGPINEAPSAAVETIKPPPLHRRLTIGVAVAAVAVALIAALLGLNVGGLRQRIFAASAPTRIQSLAVLPLTNLSGDPAQEYFSDGMTDALITDLAQIASLKVISRTSVMRYKKIEKPLPEIARELNVDGIVEGTVQRSGDRVRITAQLIHGPSDKHLWAESYERDLRDVLALQDHVARDIAAEIRVRLTPDVQGRLSDPPLVQPAVYEDYLKGRYWWNKRTEEGLNKAIEYFQRAIANDPNYALAYGGLADSHNLLAYYGFVPPKEAFPRAKEAALKALEMDDTRAEAHASLVFIKTHYDWDWPATIKESQRAIELNPSYATAHQWYANALDYTGRLDEAIAEDKRALELDPLSLVVNWDLGTAFYYARQYDRAIEQEQKTLELDPKYIPAHSWLGMCHVQKSMYKEAISEFENALTISPGTGYALAGLGYAYAVAGRKTEAQKVLDQLNELSKRKYVPATYRAIVYGGLREKDKAFEWLEKGYEDRSIGNAFGGTIKVDPIFDPLRSDPRFQNLLRRMGLLP